MASFQSSLDKLNVTGAQREYIETVVKRHRDEGKSMKEAIAAALDELESDTNEQIRDVSKQINGKQQ